MLEVEVRSDSDRYDGRRANYLAQGREIGGNYLRLKFEFIQIFAACQSSVILSHRDSDKRQTYQRGQIF